MTIFMGCSVYFWIGVLIFLGGGAAAYSLSKRSAQRALEGRSAETAEAPTSWPFIVAVAVSVLGLALAGNTMWQGDCTVAAGPCPPSISTGSGYPCAASGVACKVAGLFNGKCTNEASALWNCACQCR